MDNDELKQTVTDSMNAIFENEQVRRLIRMQFAMQMIAHNPHMRAQDAYTLVDEVIALA